MHTKAEEQRVCFMARMPQKEKLCSYSGKQFKILTISKTYKSVYLIKILLLVVLYLRKVFFKTDLLICGPMMLKGQFKSSRCAFSDFQSSDF